MIIAKAKDAKDWNIWHLGFLEAPDKIRTDGQIVDIIPRTVCENTMVKCQGVYVYENDWLEIDVCGEIHKFLVARNENEFRAFEDESVSYSLMETVKFAKIVGNLYG